MPHRHKKSKYAGAAAVGRGTTIFFDTDTPIKFPQAPIATYQMIFPNGDIAEYEAEPKIGEPEHGPEGFSIPVSLTIIGTPRFGSIYDREGAD